MSKCAYCCEGWKRERVNRQSRTFVHHVKSYCGPDSPTMGYKTVETCEDPHGNVNNASPIAPNIEAFFRFGCAIVPQEPTPTVYA